jgi:hypothetical protein
VNKWFIQSHPIHRIHFIVSNFLSGSPVCSFTCCVFKACYISRLHSVPKYNHSNLQHILYMGQFVNKNMFVHVNISRQKLNQ